MVELRKSKGLTKDQAYDLLKDPLYLATVMIKNNDAAAGSKYRLWKIPVNWRNPWEAFPFSNHIVINISHKASLKGREVV